MANPILNWLGPLALAHVPERYKDMSFSINQMNQLANKLAKMGWDESRVTQLGQANPKKFRSIEAILDGASLDKALQTAVSVGSDTTHLRYLQEAMLAPTSGATTLSQAGDVFTGYIDDDFERFGTNKFGVDREETPVDIYEMKKNGTFAEIFGSFGADVRSFCLSQGQIKEFARSHRHLLRQDGYATFFLFEVEGDLFVARVHVVSGELRVRVYRFSNDSVCRAGYRDRVVVPQQAL